MIRVSSLALDLLLIATFAIFCLALANQGASDRAKREDPIQPADSNATWTKWTKNEDKKLKEEEAKNHQIVINPEGQIVIHGDGSVPAEGHELIKMIFEKQVCGAKVNKDAIQPCIVLTIDHRNGSACDEGVIFCYVGRLDPENSEHLGKYINNQFQISNEDNNEIAVKCNEKKWPSWGKNTLHGFSLNMETVNGKKFVQLKTSTHRESMLYNLTDGNIKLHLGTPGQLGGYVENQGEPPSFPASMRKGMLLGEEKADFCLAYDLLMGVKKDIDLLGLIIPKFATCQMTITIGGPGLRSYTGNNTAEKRSEEDKVKNEKVKVPKGVNVYDGFFEPDNLVWITDNSHLPENLRKDIFLEIVNDTNGEEAPRVVISSQGEERMFTIAGINDKYTGNGVNFTWIRPVHDKFCVKARQFRKNEMVIMYNKRPDCSVRFQWGERKAKCMDDMGFGDPVLSIKDQLIFMQDRDEFHTKNQFGEETQLCRGSCPMEPDEIENEHKGLAGMDDKDYLWHFVLYPNRGRIGNEDVKYFENPNCVLAIAFDLREYNFFLPKGLY